MQRKRRSGRIAKEINIVLLGTDTMGKVFSEQTKTVLLSRHGAGVISRYRFAPDEVLTLRMPASTKEAEVRLVGQIGGESGRYIYGVAFVDPDPHFWPIEFPPPDSFEPAGDFLVLECALCHARQSVEQHEIEEDVYSVNGNILRYCEACGTSTPWKKAQDDTVSAPAPKLPRPAPDPPPASHAPSSNATPSVAPPVNLPSRSPATSYSGASVVQEFASLSDTETRPAASSAAVAVLPPPNSATSAPQLACAATRPLDSPSAAPPAPQSEQSATRLFDPSGRPINRRTYVRIRVNFNACVRSPDYPDEIVECENMSRGGVCFHSLLKFALGSRIEIAAPFSPGETALFVPAQIRRIEPLSGGKVFRYGVEYIRSASAR